MSAFFTQAYNSYQFINKDFIEIIDINSHNEQDVYYVDVTLYDGTVVPLFKGSLEECKDHISYVFGASSKKILTD